MEEFRPEYVEALNAARWGWLWYVTLAVPFLLLTPSIVKRKYGSMPFPAAYFLTWLAFNLHIQNYWAVKKANVGASDEWADVTARLFASVTTIPYVFVYVSLVGAVLYGVTRIMQLCFKSKT